MPVPQISRRRFLELGATGALSLAAFGTAATLAGCSSGPARVAAGYRWLSDEDLALFGALLAVVNGPALPADAPVRTEALRRIDLACSCLAAPAQAQTRQLLELLHWPPFRRFACGVAAPWDHAAPAELLAFLHAWRDSRLQLFNAGYRGLTRLAALGWWSQPQSWASSRYPGPPAWAVAELKA
ncbi:MAG: hypothetical protein ACLGI7_07900 [Gammaproteobacteria bacterium]